MFSLPLAGRAASLLFALFALVLSATSLGAQMPATQALCLTDYQGGNRVFWNSSASGLDRFTFADDNGGQFIVNDTEGTVRIVGEIVSISDDTQRFAVDLMLSNRLEVGDVGYPPIDSPKIEGGNTEMYDVNGGPIDTSTWTYWTEMTGTFTGLGAFAGALVNVEDRGAAPQYGLGANLIDSGLGVSTWTTMTTVQQPTTGTTLPASWHGDINGTVARQCQAFPFPGNEDDLQLCTGVDGDPPSRGFGASVSEGIDGQTLSITVKSPNDTYAGMPLILAANLFPTADPLPAFYGAPFEGVYMTPGSPLVFEIFGPNGIYGPANLSPSGFFNVQLPIFDFLEGFSLIFQAFVISDQATNGLFAMSDAHRFDVVSTAITPAAPENVNAQGITDRQIEVSWDEVQLLPEGIGTYRVYANDILRTEVSGNQTSATLTNLIELTSYDIEVSAVSILGYEGPRSAAIGVTTLADLTPPVVQIAAATSETTIEVEFDEMIEPACALELANYAVDQGVVVTGVSLAEDGRCVTLTTGLLDPNLPHVLTLNGIEDMSQAHNRIATDTQVTVSTNLRVTEGLVSLYLFDEGEGTTINDRAGNGTPLDLTIANASAVTWQNGGLAVNQGTIIESAASATKIAEACQATNAMTIEAWVRPFNTTQAGPARIATFSTNTANRNFTLGQEGGDYVMRLRTTSTDNNGMPNLMGANAVDLSLKHLVFTREAAGSWSLWVDGVEVDSGIRIGDFSNWDAGWKFALANEVTMDRAWLGELHLVAVYDQALDADEVQKNFQAGTTFSEPVLSPRVADGLVSLYEFSEGQGTTVADSAGAGAPLDLTIADASAVSWQNGGLAVNQGTIIETASAATKIANACQTSNAITLEAWIKPFNTTQAGPARIATFSTNTVNRNFTLGQEGSDYAMRLRTTTTDNNGMPNLIAAGGADLELRHVVFTRAASGDWSLWLDGVEVDSGVRTGDFSNWDGSWKFALANELSMNRAWLGEYHLVAIYDRALDATEVQQNLTAGH